jgi:hypothetical protein
MMGGWEVIYIPAVTDMTIWSGNIIRVFTNLRFRSAETESGDMALREFRFVDEEIWPLT